MDGRSSFDGAKALDPGWKRVPPDLLEAELHWQPDVGDQHVYRVVAAGNRWTLHVSDFPDEVMFTLFREDSRLADFDERPAGWHLASH